MRIRGKKPSVKHQFHHLSKALLLFLSRNYQRLCWGGLGFPPLEGVVVSVTQCSYSEPCDKAVWEAFPWSATYSGQPPTSSWIFKIWRWLCWLICVLLWETMHNESPFLPPSLPFHKQTQDASLIYLFLDCMPARESTADCILQQFSRILQSHFISFSWLNPMTLT